MRKRDRGGFLRMLLGAVAVFALCLGGSAFADPTNCVAPPSGLISWWPGNGNATDIAGVNNGTLMGGINFVAGEVGQAFSLNGTDAGLRVPASRTLDVGSGGGMTIESWIKPMDSAVQQDLVEWNDGLGFFGAHFTISNPYGIGGPGSLWANLIDTNGAAHPLTSATGLITSSNFQHVAVTYDKTSGIGTLYLNGGVIAQTNLGSFTPYTSSD